MNRLIQINLLGRRFTYAVVISVLFFTANLVISHAQSSNLLSSGNQPQAVQTTEAEDKSNLADPDVAESADDPDWTVSDPPAATDPNNSTGDEVLLRPPR